MFGLVLKAVLGLVVAVALVIVAGFNGLLFWVWPTGINDEPLVYTEHMAANLRKLEAEHKFDPDMTLYYPGAASEATRASAQAVVDDLIHRLIVQLPSNPRRSTVLSTIKHALPGFADFDSEERDRALLYVQQVMDITGVRSSGELLNVWRYGFPYGWLPSGA